jgi:predicted metal-dependent phosphoesterase TrpH
MTIPHLGDAHVGATPHHPAALLRCELHTHTLYSRDCVTPLESLLAASRRKGLDRLAVTDHNSIAGALRLQRMDAERIIIGEEIRTTRGELIAYFLTELVPPGLSPEEAIRAVRDQGGVVGVSHPLDGLRREAMGRSALLPLLGELDFIEVFNARCLLPTYNHRARALAAERKLLMTAGSDAHCNAELGRAVMLMPPFDSAASFLESLRRASILARPGPFWTHLASSYAKIARRLGWAPRPEPEGG